MFADGRRQPELVQKARFSNVRLVQVPPESGVGPVVRHAEDGPFHLPVQLPWQV
jgi:hypothetical protein